MEMHSLTLSSFIICLWGETFGLRTILFIGNSPKIKHFFGHKGKEGMGIPKIFDRF